MGGVRVPLSGGNFPQGTTGGGNGEKMPGPKRYISDMSARSLHHATEQLYAVFAAYPRKTMHYCDCGCTDPEEVAVLYHHPLRETNEGLANYTFSAITTMGDLEDFKHFLPRLLELAMADWKVSAVDLDDLSRKMIYAQWRTWPPPEVTAVRNYLLESWGHAINTNPDTAVNTLLRTYLDLIPLPDLLAVWEVATSTVALDNFIDFFYYYGYEVLDDKYPSRKHSLRADFAVFLREQRVGELVEARFFALADGGGDLAMKTSAVAGMLEA